MNARERVGLNGRLYDYFLNRKILRNRKGQPAETVVSRIRDLALLAWMNHPGFFADGRIENILLEIGETLAEEDADPRIRGRFERECRPVQRPAVLLVASHVYEVGGHTKVVEKFIEGYADWFRVLVLTEQQDGVPEALRQREAAGEVRIFRLAGCDGTIRKAATLRAIGAEFDQVFLFTHPNDPTPVLAFCGREGPPVLFDNHAHFFFSLGVSVSDLVVSHVRYMDTLSAARRFAAGTFCFPLRYSRYRDRIGGPVDKRRAKQEIGLGPDALCLLSVVLGLTVFSSPGREDFFRTAARIVRRYPQAHLCLIGIEPQHPYAEAFAGCAPEQVRFLGIVPDPLRYYQAADLYLDPFPYPSFGALLEAITVGEACPLLAHGTGSGVLDSAHLFDSLPDGKPRDEADYFERLDTYVRFEAKRREVVRVLKAEQIAHEEAFPSRLASLQETSGTLRHLPRRLPDGPSGAPTEDDLQVADMSQLRSYGALLEKMRKTALMGRGLGDGYLADRVALFRLFLGAASSCSARAGVWNDLLLAVIGFLRRKVGPLFRGRRARNAGE